MQEYHFRQPSCRDDVSSMYKPVQMPRRLLDLLPHIVVDFHIEDICDEIQRILVILHLCVETSEIESVGEVVLVNLAEVFVSP